MKHIINRGFMIAALVAAWYMPSIAQSVDSPGMRVIFAEGTVRLQKPSSEGWLKADTGSVVLEKEKISTGEDSRAVLGFLDGQQVRLGSRTELAYTSFGGSDSVSTVYTFHPGAGDIWVNFGSIPVTRTIACAAHFKKGMALVEPILDSIPAVFRMGMGADSTYEIKVYRGLIYVTFDSLEASSDSLNSLRYPEYNAPKNYGDIHPGVRTAVIQPYQKLILTSSGCLVYKGAFASSDPDEQIDWVEWNRNRDK
jgi:hypothetical protein